MATDLAMKAMQNRLAEYERRLEKVERYAASGRFLSYSPTLSGTGWAIGNGATTGSYTRLGNLVYFWARATFSTTSTYGAGRPTLTIPFTAKVASTGVAPVLNASCFTATFTYVLFPRILSTRTAVEFYASRTVVPGVVPATVYHTIAGVSSAIPAAWAAGDLLYLQGVYEAEE